MYPPTRPSIGSSADGPVRTAPSAVPDGVRAAAAAAILHFEHSAPMANASRWITFLLFSDIQLLSGIYFIHTRLSYPPPWDMRRYHAAQARLKNLTIAYYASHFRSPGSAPPVSNQHRKALRTPR